MWGTLDEQVGHQPGTGAELQHVVAEVVVTENPGQKIVSDQGCPLGAGAQPQMFVVHRASFHGRRPGAAIARRLSRASWRAVSRAAESDLVGVGCRLRTCWWIETERS